MALDDFIQGVFGAVVVIIMIFVFAPLLIEISKLTHTEAWGYFGAAMLVIFGILVIIVAILKFIRS